MMITPPRVAGALLFLSTILTAAAADAPIAAAASMWQPISGSPPAETVRSEGRDMVRFRCAFATSTTERASWDLRTPLDLSAARGIQFRMLCTNPAPVSSFVAYFESPPGWYRAEFAPESVDGWETITIDKMETHKEGEPGGWDQIRTIRISAWRGQDKDTEFLFGDLRAMGNADAKAVVAILRADAAGLRSADEAKTVAEYTDGLSAGFRALDIPHVVLGDGEITDASLQRFKLVALPYNPSVPAPATEALLRFVARGGRLMGFYSLPGELLRAVGVAGGAHVRQRQPGDFAAIHFVDASVDGAPPVVGQRSWNINDLKAIPGTSRVLATWQDEKGQDTGHAALIGSSNGLVMTHVLLKDDPVNKRRMLMAMAAHLLPELWEAAARAAIERIPADAGFRAFEEAADHIAKLGGTAGTAKAARDAARTALESRHFASAIEKATTASRELLEAWCAAQKPQRDEFRAFWCHDAFGVRGLTWDEAIGRLATNGFTAIIPNMLWGGSAFYPSDVLPVAAAVQERGDQIAACVAAGRKHGVQVHVWKVNWNLGYTVPKAFTDRMRNERRLQMNAKGEELAWLCPSHPDNQKLEIDAMVEVARKYDVDGIHFDYIRYPDNDHCFCEGCRERFAAAIGTKIDHWPADSLAKGTLRQRWLDWRRGNITAVVKATSEQARALKPKIRISAAVFRSWTTDRDGVGQDWKLWCEKGWLDFVCPMDYTESNRKFDTMVTAQKEWAGPVPVYPGIGVSASSSRFGAARTIDQIGIARKHQTGGFIIFNYGENESRTLLPLLGAGITRRE